MITFKDDSYAEMINQTIRHHPNASDDAKAIADSIMVAGAFIAESLNAAFDNEGFGNVTHHIQDLALSVEQLTEKLTDAISEHAVRTEQP